MDTFEIVAKTFQGLENVLAHEIEEIGGKEVVVLNRAVSFQGDKYLLYKANYYLRTAVKVLKPFYKFNASNEQELYDGIYAFDWSEHIKSGNTFAIESSVSSEFFNHSQYVSLKVKDAIADQFREKTGKRPSVDTENPSIRINIYIHASECSVSLDSSGDSLHKRGYRIATDVAPLNEVLAAGMLLLAGWEGKGNFIDPMCGSGTLPIEAAMIAYNLPAGMYRKEFGFEKWHDFEPELFENIIDEDSPDVDFQGVIIGNDISSKAIQIARGNVRNASLQNKIELKVVAIEDFLPPQGGGLVVMNPPYGERLKKNNIEDFYKVIGNRLKKYYTGYESWVLSYNKEAMKNLGLHSSVKHTLYNGALECKFQKYNLYEGSVKSKYRGNDFSDRKSEGWT